MPVAPLPKVRADLVEVSRRLHHNGWVANHDGNLSLRLTGDRLLITPTAVSKLDVDESMLLIVDMAGTVLEGRRKPFSELSHHLAVYRARPDVEVVIHAHPAHATAFGLVGAELAPIAMPEIIVSLGERIPTLPRVLPKSDEAIRLIEEAAKQFNAVLCSGNGAFTWGVDLEQALLRMELVEHYAKILTIARSLGTVAPLSPSDIGKLTKK